MWRCPWPDGPCAIGAGLAPHASGPAIHRPRKLDASAVHQQVQRPVGTAIRDLHLQGLLSAARRGVVRNRPIQPGQAQQAGDHPCGLPERQLDQPLVDKQNWIAAFEKTGGRPWRPSCVPSHLLVPPDQQRPAPPERVVAGRPVRHEAAGGLGLAHAARLTAAIPDANPSQGRVLKNDKLLARSVR